MHFATQFFLAHMKFKSKISYLGKRNSRIHRQMTEQWLSEVDEKMVKNRKKCTFSSANGRGFFQDKLWVL